MKIETQLHTIFMLVGPTECGKTTFAQQVLLPQLAYTDPVTKFRTNVQYLGSDAIRQELLGHPYDKYASNMLESSGQAFELLYTRLRPLLSFPIHADFVVIDSMALNAEQRADIKKIAAENHYHLQVIVFDYNVRDYYYSERSRAFITKLVRRLKTEVLPVLSGEGYHRITRIRQKDFQEAEAAERYQVTITDLEAYRKCLLPARRAYLIIGDVHECVAELQELLVPTYFEIDAQGMLTRTPDTTKHAEIIFVGDWIDKGKATREIITFLYQNRAHFHFVMGNHEQFVWNYLQGRLQGVEETVVSTYFDSIAVLEQDTALYEKFEQLCRESKPFLRVIDETHRSFYVTHAPCRKKYLGKLDKRSQRKMRTFHLDRTQEVEPQLAFLQEEQSFVAPYHFFGHVAVKRPIRLANNIGIDTGVVQGNCLSAAKVWQGRVRIESKAAQGTRLVGEVPDVFVPQPKVLPLTAEEQQRIDQLAYDSVNFLSGTMSPADKNERTGVLESLEAGLAYFQTQGVQQLVLQPKYMGSRCNVYLFQQPEACYAISRNGFRIKQVELRPIYEQLLNRLGPYMQDNDIKMLVLDGELLPWKALGDGLLRQRFQPIANALVSETAFLQENDFEKKLAQLHEKLEQSHFEQDLNQATKAEVIAKYGSFTYQNYRAALQLKAVAESLSEHEAAAAVYCQQLELYGADAPLSYQPFAILKQENDQGEVSFFTGSASEMFTLLNTDLICSLDLSQPGAYEVAANYFSELTLQHGMEGVVIKPEHPHKGVAPYLKVRNADYLTLVYGYDYRFEQPYRSLHKNKRIKRKLQTSIKEYELGQQLLQIPHAQLTSTNPTYVYLLQQFLSLFEAEKTLDQRL